MKKFQKKFSVWIFFNCLCNWVTRASLPFVLVWILDQPSRPHYTLSKNVDHSIDWSKECIGVVLRGGLAVQLLSICCMSALEYPPISYQIQGHALTTRTWINWYQSLKVLGVHNSIGFLWETTDKSRKNKKNRSCQKLTAFGVESSGVLGIVLWFVFKTVFTRYLWLSWETFGFGIFGFGVVVKEIWIFLYRLPKTDEIRVPW